MAKVVKKILDGEDVYQIKENTNGVKSRFYIIRKPKRFLKLKRPIYLDNKYHDSIESAVNVVNKHIEQ